MQISQDLQTILQHILWRIYIKEINFIFLRFIEVWTQWAMCKVSDEPQKDEIHFLYLHFLQPFCALF